MPALMSDRNEHPAWLSLLLLWLCGITLRLTILAVPPVLPMIRGDFGLSATAVGVLGSVAPALFACAAVGGALPRSEPRHGRGAAGLAHGRAVEVGRG